MSHSASIIDATESHKAVLRRFPFLLHDPDGDAICALFTEDFRLHAPNAPNWPSGHAGAVMMFTDMHKRFPELEAIAEDMFGDGERICVRWRYRNRVGERFEAVGISIYRFEGARIAEDWGVDYKLPNDHPWLKGDHHRAQL
jgi:predicted SnoaL-like aldol condensation-catalyzing enzyme